MRPTHWLKNGFVVAPLLFAREFLVATSVLTIFGYAILFSLASSAVYLLNDITDRERDRANPDRAMRPLAAGEISVRVAAIVSLFLGVVALSGAFYLSFYGFFVLLIYIVMNISYSLFVKDVVVLDVLFIATGFVLRAVGGALVISAVPSEWLILCSFLLALFLGFCKRRQELVASGKRLMEKRKSIKGYTVQFVDSLISICAGCTIISYAIYTLSPVTIEKFGTSNLLLTLPFVIFGIFRYMNLVLAEENESSPAELLMGDRALLLTVVLWGISSGLIVY
jgi:4-hydroxybenzoate polyprenyltransferase